MTTRTPSSLLKAIHPLWLVGVILAVLLGLAITVQVIGAGFDDGWTLTDVAASPAFSNIIAVNLLIGIAALLFVQQMGWGALRAVLTVATALLIGFFILSLISSDPVNAYQNLLGGPLSQLNRWGNWINDALALILVGLAITLVFRAQLFSLGAEGQIYLGAMVAGWVALFVPNLPAAIHIPLALAAGCAAGFLWGLIPGLLRAYLGANELVSTLMLNPIAIALYELLLIPLKPPRIGAIVSADFPPSAILPKLVAGAPVTSAVFYAVVAVIVTWAIIQRTPLGYEIRMFGANARFARYGGINTKRTIVLSMAVSGILAGLTGGYLVLAIHQKLRLGISSGLAFEGIVVALLARNKPLAVPAMGLLYAYLRTGADVMQSQARVSLEIVRVIQAIIILLITAEALVDFIRWRRNTSTTLSADNKSQEAVTHEQPAPEQKV
jgi:general nucleoside transport system permease protein